MCRWNAFRPAAPVDELLFRTEHGLIDQSLHSRMGAETTNGDGFGVGWYGAGEDPARYRSVAPPGATTNLRELAAHVESPLFLAHIRATTGSRCSRPTATPSATGVAVRPQRRHRRLPRMRRDLLLAVDPALFDGIAGLDRLRAAVLPRADLRPRAGPARRGRARGRARRGDRARARGREPGADDARLQRRRAAVGGALLVRAQLAHAVRLRGRDALRRLHPDNPRCSARDEDRVVVSEPLADLPGAWIEVPESTALIVQPGPTSNSRSSRATSRPATDGAPAGSRRRAERAGRSPAPPCPRCAAACPAERARPRSRARCARAARRGRAPRGRRRRRPPRSGRGSRRRCPGARRSARSGARRPRPPEQHVLDLDG